MTESADPWPPPGPELDLRIRELRGLKTHPDPFEPVRVLVEPERMADGRVVDALTVFLADRECPLTCLMCDLWRNTLNDSPPPGAIVAQVARALEPPGSSLARTIKLYNAGSFFDRLAVGRADRDALPPLLERFERVVVECHPALVGDDLLAWSTRLNGRLEVAMGLETVHPVALPRLNKRMSLELFSKSAGLLASNEVPFRVFVLLGLPFVVPAQAADWAVASVEFALGHGAERVVILPTRAGNGALDLLAESGHFVAARLSDLEDALDRALSLARGKAMVCADTWDAGRLARCPRCLAARVLRLERIGLEQAFSPRVSCDDGSCEEPGRDQTPRRRDKR